MTYDDFMISVQSYLSEGFTGWKLAFALFLLAGIILFFVAYGRYIYKIYKCRKSNIDTFEQKIDPNLKFPGFHQGVFRDEDDIQKYDDEVDRKDKSEQKSETPQKKKKSFFDNIRDE